MRFEQILRLNKPSSFTNTDFDAFGHAWAPG